MELDEILKRDFEETTKFPLPWEMLRRKRILCTGATGCIGKYLSRFLYWLNHQYGLEMELWLLRRPGTSECLTGEGIHWIEGQIAEEFIPAEHRFHIIIHMASPAHTKAYFTDPTGLAEANIFATKYMLEYARANDTLFLFFSSGAVAHNETGRVSEISPMALIKNGGGLTIYSASKLTGELLCEKYRNCYGTDCRVVRPFNVRGPGEPLDSDRFFPSFLREILHSGKITVTGSGTPVRDFCYLSDVVSGILFVLLRGESTVYNIGNEDSTCTILECAKKIVELYGSGTVIGPLCETRQTAGNSLVPDTAKLRRLGWQPQVSLDDCIRRCLESYRQECTS